MDRDDASTMLQAMVDQIAVVRCMADQLRERLEVCLSPGGTLFSSREQLDDLCSLAGEFADELRALRLCDDQLTRYLYDDNAARQ